MTSRRAKIVVAGAVLLLAGGCCGHVGRGEASRMPPLEAALLKLTSTVDASVAYEHQPVGLDEQGLLAFTTRMNPAVREPFAGYRVRVRGEDRHAVVLVCDERGNRALLEDVGCTMELDRLAWKEQPASPCEFTLHVKSSCVLPAASGN